MRDLELGEPVKWKMMSIKNKQIANAAFQAPLWKQAWRAVREKVEFINQFDRAVLYWLADSDDG